jgi:hypothetical protein
MDEFAALAQRVVLTMDDVRGCLVLSRDGLVLGAFPEEQEAELKPAWLRFVHVGEARKGFVEFSDQLWAFVHRGPYAAFVVTGTSVRPGVMLDQLEQAVIAAEEARAKQKEVTLKVPDAAGAPSGRPRTSLHPPADRPATAPVGANQAEEMPSFAAPSGPVEDESAAPAWSGADPSQMQQMQAMQEQMAAMQAQLEQTQALQTPIEPAPYDAPAVQPSTAQPPAAAQPPTAPPGVAQPPTTQPAATHQPLSGYRRPGSASQSPAAEPAPVEQPRTELGGSRPSIEGSPYESVLADDQPAPFGSESSPFARLEAEQAQAAAEHSASPSYEDRPTPSSGEDPLTADASTFRTEPQRLVSTDAPAPAPDEPEEPGEVDRVMLAKEFSGLLQLDGDGDED